MRAVLRIFIVSWMVVTTAACSLQAGIEGAQGTASQHPPPIPTDPRAVSQLTGTPTQIGASGTVVPSPTTVQPSATPTPTPTQRPTSTATTRPAAQPPATSDVLSIEYFTATPTTVYPGQGVRLAWKAHGPVRQIQTVLDNRRFGQWYNDLPEEGTLDVTVPAESRNVIQYMLVVSRPAPSTESVSSQLNVPLLCPDEWFFEPAPADCPRTAVATPAATQTFEHGRMLWRASDKVIYVVYEDGSLLNMYDPWSEGEPESDPSIVPPSGFYQPVRGFGLVWRETSGVRDRLGWATAPEAEFQMTYQCDTTWNTLHLNYTYCYVRGPQGEIIRMDVIGGDWMIVAGG